MAKITIRGGSSRFANRRAPIGRPEGIAQAAPPLITNPLKDAKPEPNVRQIVA